MAGYDYLIIGGGMTADSAVSGIHAVDPAGTIGVLCSESQPPYKRPPLSKALWKGDPLESVWLTSAKAHATLHTSRTAIRIDTQGKTVTDDHGDVYAYRKLLLATGGRVRTLPVHAEGIIYFRTVHDYQNLRLLTNQNTSFAVIGGGFIGSEIAASLAMTGKEVTMLFPDDGIGWRVYPKRLAEFITGYFAQKSVRMLTGREAAGIALQDGLYHIKTSRGEDLHAQVVVAGIGIQPNVELAQAAGLTVNNGIVVDEYLETSHAGISAAGDVANFFNPALDRRLRVEHEDNANDMGERAGRNMAGEKKPYHHLPFFYSDLFDLGYEAVGILDSRLEIVEDWKDEFHEGVIYYLEKERVVGVLLWNTWGQVDNARRLIAEKGPFTAQNIKGRLPA